MRRIVQNLSLVLFGICCGLFLIEVALYLTGRYDDLVSQKLVVSSAIWERPVNTIEYQNHPDLGVPVEIRTDADGVRNHTDMPTHEKGSIIAFFGDSFTENRRIEDRFSFTSVLDAATRPGTRVVNYGVDGYGLDQAYLRYKKYEQHDIKHVVYVFCENDLRNLYETALADVIDGKIRFIPPRINAIYRVIGSLRLTYLVISAYYQLRALVRNERAGNILKLEWSDVGKEQRIRFHDRYADSIVLDLLSQRSTGATLELVKKFILLLQSWRHEVESAGRTFSVFVLPRPIDNEVALTLFRDFDGRVVYSAEYFGDYRNFRFAHDDHWNEYGNLQAAKFILSNEVFGFRGVVGGILDEESLKHGIDAYYKAPK